MRRAAVLMAVVISAFLAPSASARPPMPCDYWIHGCNVAEYLCDAGVCISPTTAVSIPVLKP